MKQAVAIVSIPLLLVGGAWVAAIIDRLHRAMRDDVPAGNVLLAPLAEGAALLLRQSVVTERPDLLNWRLAPVFYFALAALGLSVVPLAPGLVAADSDAGIVLWGACEALTVVVVFLHGWSSNAPLALIGAYRYVAIALPVMLVSMFVLIAAALPAESLSVSAVVAAQKDTVWNVVRQPPGFVLFMLLALSVSVRGPFDYADSPDLAGGTSSEASGAQYAAWQFARLAMLVSASVMAATVFLGGYLGPVLPGPVWLLLKSVAVLAALVMAGNAFARTTPARMLHIIWTVLLPLSFLVLVLVGLEVLLWA